MLSLRTEVEIRKPAYDEKKQDTRNNFCVLSALTSTARLDLLEVAGPGDESLWRFLAGLGSRERRPPRLRPGETLGMTTGLDELALAGFLRDDMASAGKRGK